MHIITSKERSFTEWVQFLRVYRYIETREIKISHNKPIINHVFIMKWPTINADDAIKAFQKVGEAFKKQNIMI